MLNFCSTCGGKDSCKEDEIHSPVALHEMRKRLSVPLQTYHKDIIHKVLLLNPRQLVSFITWPDVQIIAAHGALYVSDVILSLFRGVFQL